MSALRNVNLNLLPILQAILRAQNITRAAESLNMSQSAVSDALARLRHLFGDELLVRAGRRMMLTAFAESLLPQVDTAIEDIGRILGQPEIDPQAIRRRFVVGTADSVMSNIGPRLLEALRIEAPGADLQFVTLNSAVRRAEQAGQVDLIIGPKFMWDPAETLWSEPLYEERFVCIMRADHPLASKRFTAEDYWSAPHASYRPDYQAGWTSEDEFMRRERTIQRDVLRVPHFSLLPRFVETSDCLAFISARLANRLAVTHRIAVRDLPFESGPVEFRLYWTAIHHNDPTHRWFRELAAREGRVAATEIVAP